MSSDLDGAVTAVERFWGSDWPPEIVVVATGSAQQFQAAADLDPGREWKDIAAVAVADEVDVANRRVVGARIVLAPGASEMSDQALRIVLTHELFHLAARADAGDRDLDVDLVAMERDLARDRRPRKVAAQVILVGFQPEMASGHPQRRARLTVEGALRFGIIADAAAGQRDERRLGLQLIDLGEALPAQRQILARFDV